MKTRARSWAVNPNTKTKKMNKLKQAAKAALADLEGIMPEFDPSGDREHPAWQTIHDLKVALSGFELGDEVDVTPVENDMFHEFTGTIRAFRDGRAVVVDQSNDAWDVAFDQLERV
jgi:hypothetical protein